ncbi:MAG: WYL domain-containing protein [Gemmatimonadaceae bacterium]|nr:WYL domain-containing protein [Gemmatimonadaceae bacterium]MDQ3519241.1 WYL domain-containing protein [Gemmatimonadota bacterium]
MSDAAAAQLRRILHVIPLLGDGKEHELGDLAARVEVERETVVKDLLSVALRFDDPGGFVEGIQIYVEANRVSLVTRHFLRPMRLTASELRALDLGLAMLRAERLPEKQGAIDRARERLRQVIAKLPPTDGMSLEASTGADVSARKISVLRDALSNRRKATLLYRKADATESTQRGVSPYAIVSASGAWYLVAFCERSSGVRMFRLDRIEEITPLDESYEVPDDFALDELLASGKVYVGETLERLRVRYSPRVARWVAEREGVPLAKDGSVTVDHPFADLDWAVRHVLRYGPDAEVLQPAPVRQEIARRLDGIRVLAESLVERSSASPAAGSA